MSADPVILDVLVQLCQEALQLFEFATLFFDDRQEGLRSTICIGKHFIFFVNKEMNALLEDCEKLSYLDIDRAVADTSTGKLFMLEVKPTNDSAWQGGSRILVQSEHRGLILQRIALCWQAEVMYRCFEVKKFPQAKAAIGEQLQSVKANIARTHEHVKVKPFSDYDEDFHYCGYSLWLRKGFKSFSGLRDGTFVHDEGWTVTYNAQPVVIPKGVRVVLHVGDESMIMDAEKSSAGLDDLRTTALEYQRSLTDNLDHFYVLVSGQYTKRMNRTDDIAIWNGWEFFIRSKDYAFVCVIFRRSYMPPLCSTTQDIAVVLRCPAQSMRNDATEVLLDECRFVADSIASEHDTKMVYRHVLQARLDTLHFNEEGYRFCEGQLGMVPVHRRAAIKFVKSIVKILCGVGVIEQGILDEPEVFKDVPTLQEPLRIAEDLMTEAEPLLGNAGGKEERDKRRNAWNWRIARYFAYCLDGPLLGDRFSFATLVQCVGKWLETDDMLKAVIEFLLHVTPINDWSQSYKEEGGGSGLQKLLREPGEYFSNELIMRQLVSQNYIANEWRKRESVSGKSYEVLLAELITSETVGLGLKSVMGRQILDMLGRTSHEGVDFDKTVKSIVPSLLKVMKGNSLVMCSYATAALVNLSCGRDSMKQLLVGEGVLRVCVQQLKSRHDELILYSLYLLVNLTKTPHHRYIVIKEGAVPLLVEILTCSYQNLRKQRILAEVSSVIGQLCNDPEARGLISESFPVVPCLLWVNDSAQPNTKLKAKVLFALRQLCVLGQNKIKVGQHIIPVLLDELTIATSHQEECAVNLLLLMNSLASVNSNAVMMAKKDAFDRMEIDIALESCGILDSEGKVTKSKLAKLLEPKVEALKKRIQDAEVALGNLS